MLARYMLSNGFEESGKRPATRRADALFTKVLQQMSEDRGGGEITIRRSEKNGQKRGQRLSVRVSNVACQFSEIKAVQVLRSGSANGVEQVASIRLAVTSAFEGAGRFDGEANGAPA